MYSVHNTHTYITFTKKHSTPLHFIEVELSKILFSLSLTNPGQNARGQNAIGQNARGQNARGRNARG